MSRPARLPDSELSSLQRRSVRRYPRPAPEITEHTAGGPGLRTYTAPQSVPHDSAAWALQRLTNWLTRSSPPPRMLPVISSSSTIGRNSCTKSLE